MALHWTSVSEASGSTGQAQRRWNWGQRVGARAAAGGNNAPLYLEGS